MKIVVLKFLCFFCFAGSAFCAVIAVITFCQVLIEPLRWCLLASSGALVLVFIGHWFNWRADSDAAISFGWAKRPWMSRLRFRYESDLGDKTGERPPTYCFGQSFDHEPLPWTVSEDPAGDLYCLWEKGKREKENH